MKFYFGLFTITLFVFLSLPYENMAKQTCNQWDCVSSELCEDPLKGGVCPNSNDVCCSFLKPQARTNCHHHGGQCMKSCNQALTMEAVDCDNGMTCCLLI